MMKKIVFGLMISVSVLMADFVRSGEHVTDTDTELMWQDDSQAGGVNFIGWAEAITQCETLSLDGFNDWRLPNINELYSIVDHSRSPTISPIFQNTNTFNYWSSTTDSSDTDFARLVGFSLGNDIGENKVFTQTVRCVRVGE